MTVITQKCIFSVIMNELIKDIKLIEKYSGEMSGVFSIRDLESLLGQKQKVILYRRLSVLEKEGILTRFTRGYYTTPQFDKEVLTSRVNGNCYLSLGTVLAKYLLIGSVPTMTVYAVKTGKTRSYESPYLNLLYVGISKNLFFDYTVENGVRYATAEKALLDTLYFYQKGHHFSFNIYDDIDISLIDRDHFNSSLQVYNNPRFVSFAKGYINDRY